MIVPVIFAEESEELRIDLVDDGSEVVGFVFKVHTVRLDDKDASAVLAEDEVLVFVIEPLQVVNLHRLLIVPSAFLYLCDEGGYGLAQVNHHVRHLHLPFHQFEELHEGLVVAFGEVSALIVVAYEDIDTLKDRAVLHDGMGSALHCHHVLEAFLEEIRLQAERPAVDVVVIILQIRVETHALKARFPPVILRQHLGQRRLTCSYISGYRDVH